ncbi:MAG: AsmA family protein [Neisseria sp.]|nr:AsmA family protein [Neisseria sp.]
MLSFVRSGRFWFKAAVYALGTTFVLTAAGQMILFFLFNTDRVYAAVQQALAPSGYRVHFETHIGRSWFPAPSINLYRFSLEPQAYEDEPLFSAERVNVRLSYASLFGAVKVAKITVTKPTINAVHFRDGSWNTDAFLHGKHSPATLPQRVVMHDGVLNLYDENSGRRYQLSALNLDYDASLLQLGAHLTQGFAYAPQLKLQTQVLRHDVGYVLQNVSGSLNAELPYLGRTEARWQTPLLRWQRGGQWSTGKIDLEGTAAWNQLAFGINSEGWTADTTHHTARAGGLRALFHWQDKNGTWDGSLNIDDMARQNTVWRAPVAKYELTRKSREHIRVARVQAAVKFNHDTAALSLQELVATTIQTAAGGTHPLWQSELAGSLDYGRGQYLHADLAGTFDRQPLSISLRHRAGDDAPHLLDMRLDALDLTPYLPTGGSLQSIPQKLDAAFVAGEKWLNRLHSLTVQTTINIGRLSLDNWQIDKLHGTVYADRYGVAWENMAADMYGGKIEGSIKVANTSPRTYYIDQILHGVNVRDWITDWTSYPYLDGTGNILINLRLSGNNAAELAANVNGSTLVNVNDGTIRGIDMHSLLKNSESAVKNLSAGTIDFNHHTRTAFRFFTVQTRWVNGVGYTPLIAFASDNINVSGQGKLSLIDYGVDYSLSIAGKLPGGRTVNLPLRITGTPERPVYALDYRAITRDSRHEQDKQDAVKNALQQQWQLLQ